MQPRCASHHWLPCCAFRHWLPRCASRQNGEVARNFEFCNVSYFGISEIFLPKKRLFTKNKRFRQELEKLHETLDSWSETNHLCSREAKTRKTFKGKVRLLRFCLYFVVAVRLKYQKRTFYYTQLPVGKQLRICSQAGGRKPLMQMFFSL